jgi:transcriptional regulator with XRE-family HTH domain
MNTKQSRSKEAKDFLEKLAGKKLSLGGLLLSIRQGEEMTQIEFANKLAISKQYLCDIERGRRFISPKAAESFANTLGYSPEQFVRLCLQEMINKDDLHLIVSVRAA